MAIVDWDRTRDLPSRRVEVVGCASVMKLRPGVPTTLVLRKGAYIPGTKTQLQADNYGISFSDLEKDWESVIQYITTHSPPILENYPNPYTGQPYNEKTGHSSHSIQTEHDNISEQINGVHRETRLSRLKDWFCRTYKKIFG